MKRMLVCAAMVMMLATGCIFNGNGGSNVQQVLDTFFLLYGGSLDSSGGFVSPTAEDTPQMAIAHQLAIAAVAKATQDSPELTAWVQNVAQGTVVCMVASNNKCPVSKGLLIGSGHTLHFYSKTPEEVKNMRSCWASRVLADGTVIELCKPDLGVE